MFLMLFITMRWNGIPEEIKIYMDDSLYFTSVNDKTGWEAWPFDKPFYLLLNIAVGGDWGGQQGIDDANLAAKNGSGLCKESLKEDKA